MITLDRRIINTSDRDGSDNYHHTNHNTQYASYYKKKSRSAPDHIAGVKHEYPRSRPHHHCGIQSDRLTRPPPESLVEECSVPYYRTQCGHHHKVVIRNVIPQRAEKKFVDFQTSSQEFDGRTVKKGLLWQQRDSLFSR